MLGPLERTISFAMFDDLQSTGRSDARQCFEFFGGRCVDVDELSGSLVIRN
jgi:hypothetical protein